MLPNERVYALTTMGTGMAMVWANLPGLLTAAGNRAGFVLDQCHARLVTMIVVFPVLDQIVVVANALRLRGR